MVDIILAKLDNEEEGQILAPPFSILYLADALEKAGFSVRLFHEAGTNDDISTLVELVSQDKPCFVGLSTLTGPMLLPTIRASRMIKENHSAPVVWGGLHPTMLPEQTLGNDFVDIVAIGEGERTVVELAKVLCEHELPVERLSKVAGIAFKRNGQVVVNKPRPFIEDLDQLYPAWHLLDAKRYFDSGKHFYADHGFQLPQGRIGAVITSRGCPWRCGFCYNQLVNKRVFRPYSAQRVINDIRSYHERYGVTAIVFEDDYFFAAKNRALKIVRDISLPWSSNIRANHLAQWGDEFAQEIKQHNCLELRIGAESGSQKVLDLMHKDITVDQIRRAVEICLRQDIAVTIGFMVGIPGETWADSLETLALIDELESLGGNIQVLGPGIFMPYPGTPLFDLAIDYGFEPPTSLLEWSDCVYGPRQPLAPYADRRIRCIAHYRRLAYRTDLDQLGFSWPSRALRQLARLRWKHRFFSYPFDYTLPVSVSKALSGLGFATLQSSMRRNLWRQ
jgi:anaerobic magnesium-protoporphyrin IX monomethyl ester cyclase